MIGDEGFPALVASVKGGFDGTRGLEVGWSGRCASLAPAEIFLASGASVEGGFYGTRGSGSGTIRALWRINLRFFGAGGDIETSLTFGDRVACEKSPDLIQARLRLPSTKIIELEVKNNVSDFLCRAWRQYCYSAAFSTPVLLQPRASRSGISMPARIC